MASEAATTTAIGQSKVTLYWLEQSRSQRILWLLEELKVPYELKIFHRDPKTYQVPKNSELSKIHPLGKSPVITVEGPGSSKPVVIAESANICEYLISHFGQGTTLVPKQWNEGMENKPAGETEEWLRYRYYMHYAEGTIMSYMVLTLVVGQIRSASVPFFIKPITNRVASRITENFLNPNFKVNYDFLEQQIATSPQNGKYLCGPNLTGADIMVSFPLIAGGSRTGLDKEKYPKLFDYVQRIQKEPGYLKAVEKIIEIDGKYEIVR